MRIQNLAADLASLHSELHKLYTQRAHFGPCSSRKDDLGLACLEERISEAEQALRSKRAEFAEEDRCLVR